jgi:hypothetical protein
MTVAPEHLIPHAAPTRLTRRCEHLLIVLGICLPVPLLAVTGLSIPLPATVERIAAALVPWANAATLDDNQALARGAGGSIVRMPSEHPLYTQADAPAPSAADNPRPAGTGSAPSTGHGSSTMTNDENGSGSSGGSTGTRPPATGSEEPTGPTAPVQGAVDQLGQATKPVVDQVDSTVTDVLDTAGGAADGIVADLGK